MRLRFAVAICIFGQICLAQQQPTAVSDEELANRALSQKLSQQAQVSLSGGTLAPANIRYSAAVLEAAYKLDPKDPRNLRLLTEAYLQPGFPTEEGRKGAIDSLERYLKLQGGDMGAQVRMIDLQFSQMNAADQQAKYVEQLLATPSLAPEVRAMVAVRGANLALDRTEVARSKQYIEQALKLFPLCPEALELKYRQLDGHTPPAQRVALLLTILRANPAQGAKMADLAQELAKAGLVEAAQTWYLNSFTLVENRLGQTADSGLVTEYAAELLVADQVRAAEDWAHKLVERDPTNSDAAFLSLLAAKRSGTPDKIDPAVATAQSSLQTRLSRISDALNNRTASTTQPSSDFDSAADVKKLLDLGRLDFTATYASALADLAWLKIYFQSKPADAQVYIAPLRQLLAADSITLARLEGWSFLVDGKKDEARVKLSAVAASDPLSGLGMIRLDAADQPPEKIVADAKKLLNSNASGLMGAMLIEALRDKLPVMPPGPDADEVRKELEKFPTAWLDILDLRRSQNFYSIKAEPPKVSHQFGEPIMARITISNVSSYDITISSSGILKPDIWVDVRVSRPQQANIPGVSIDRITQKLVLHPKESVMQYMRLDLDGLAGLLASNPQVEIPLYFSAVTNPMTQATGIVPGPGGYRSEFSKVVSRTPTQLGTVASLSAQLQNSPADVRMRTVDMMGTYALVMRGMADPAIQGHSGELVDLIRKSSTDRLAAARAHAMLVLAYLSDDKGRSGLMQQMLADKEFAVRVVGLAALSMVSDPASRKELARPLADSDPEPIVKTLAASVMEVADLPPPTSQPATSASPSGAPSTTAPAPSPLLQPLAPSPRPGAPSTPETPTLRGGGSGLQL